MNQTLSKSRTTPRVCRRSTRAKRRYRNRAVTIKLESKKIRYVLISKRKQEQVELAEQSPRKRTRLGSADISGNIDSIKGVFTVGKQQSLTN